MYFFTGRQTQVVKLGNIPSSIKRINGSTPQGFRLSPNYTRYSSIHCIPTQRSSIIKFPHDNTIIGLISDNDEFTYREWPLHERISGKSCFKTNQALNARYIEQANVNFRKQRITQNLKLHKWLVAIINNDSKYLRSSPGQQTLMRRSISTDSYPAEPEGVKCANTPWWRVTVPLWKVCWLLACTTVLSKKTSV